MVLSRVNKRKKIDEFKKIFLNSYGVIVWDYLGISSNQMLELRKVFKRNGGINLIFKNRLAKIAFNELGVKGFEPYLKNSSSFLFVTDENSTALKELAKFFQKTNRLTFKAGYVDKVFYNTHDITEYANLPSHKELLAMLLSVIQSPLSGLAQTISAIAKNQEKTE